MNFSYIICDNVTDFCETSTLLWVCASLFVSNAPLQSVTAWIPLNLQMLKQFNSWCNFLMLFRLV